MKVYIIRHGETQLNREGILQGNLNSPLLEESKLKAKELSKWASKIDFDIVMSSQLDRAYDTAKLITDGKYSIKKNDFISEMSFGEWQGKKKEEIFQNEEYKEQYHNYFFKPESYVNISGGESYEDIIKRANCFFEDLVEFEKQGLDNILVVTHGAFIKAVVMLLKGNTLERFWDDPFVYNLSLTLLEVDDEKVNLIAEPHLDYHL